MSVRPDRLVLGQQRTDGSGRFALDYPALAPDERPYLKYYLEDRLPGQSASTIFRLQYGTGGDVWSIRVPDRPDPAAPPRFLTDGVRVDAGPPPRLIRLRSSQPPATGVAPRYAAHAARACLAYELVVHQRRWFERQIEGAHASYRRYVIPSFTPPPASHFQLRPIVGFYVGAERGGVTYYDANQIVIEPDDNTPEAISLADYQWVIPHELGHHIFEVGHPGYSMPGGSHDFYTDEVRRHYHAAYFADHTLGMSSPMLWLTDPSGHFRQWATQQAEPAAFVQQLAMDFSEGYATYIGKCFNFRRSRDRDMEHPAEEGGGFGDQPTSSYLWDLTDQQSDAGDRLQIPFGVVHMLCCRWGAELQSGARRDVPAHVHFGRTPSSYGGGGPLSRTLPGFIAYLRATLLPRYAARLDSLVRPNRLEGVMRRWAALQSGTPPGIPPAIRF